MHTDNPSSTTTLVSNIYPVVKTWINAMNEAADHSFLVLPISLSLYRTVESSSSKAVRTPHLQSSPKHLELLFRVDINAAHYSTLPPLVGEMPHPSICSARTASTPSTVPLWAPQRPHPPALQWKEERAGRRMTR